MALRLLLALVCLFASGCGGSPAPDTSQSSAIARETREALSAATEAQDLIASGFSAGPGTVKRDLQAAMERFQLKLQAIRELNGRMQDPSRYADLATALSDLEKLLAEGRNALPSVFDAVVRDRSTPEPVVDPPPAAGSGDMAPAPQPERTESAVTMRIRTFRLETDRARDAVRRALSQVDADARSR